MLKRNKIIIECLNSMKTFILKEMVMRLDNEKREVWGCGASGKAPAYLA
jgi:hypothetical protein